MILNMKTIARIENVRVLIGELQHTSILHYHTTTEYDVLDRSKTYSFYLTNN